MTQNPSDPIQPKVHAADALDALIAGARAGNRPTGYQPIDFNNPNAVAAPQLPADGMPPAFTAPQPEAAPADASPQAFAAADSAGPSMDAGLPAGFDAPAAAPRPMTVSAAPRRKHQLGEFWRHLILPMAIGGVLMLLIGAWSVKVLATSHSRMRQKQAFICLAALPVGLVLLAGALIVKLEMARQDRSKQRQQAAAAPPPDFALAGQADFATGPHPGFVPAPPEFAVPPAAAPEWQPPAVPMPPPLPPHAEVPPPPYYAPPPPPPQSEPPTIT